VQVQQYGLDVVRVEKELLRRRLADPLLTQDDVKISAIQMVMETETEMEIVVEMKAGMEIEVETKGRDV
jgi:hypothetical protein